jgi:SAM-dependent methyltransferase
MDQGDWDARYAGDELLWRADPNRFLVAEAEGLPPGRVLDVACGEGRNAVWLATRGWRATGVDFSQVALTKAQGLAAQRAVSVEWIHADLLDWVPPAGRFDLVAVLYLQLPTESRRSVYRRMASALAPGGTMLVVGHDLANLTEGYGGPQDPAVLFTPDDLVSDLEGLDVIKAERVRRPVQTDDGEVQALDALVRAVRR